MKAEMLLTLFDGLSSSLSVLHHRQQLFVGTPVFRADVQLTAPLAAYANMPILIAYRQTPDVSS